MLKQSIITLKCFYIIKLIKGEHLHCYDGLRHDIQFNLPTLLKDAINSVLFIYFENN